MGSQKYYFSEEDTDHEFLLYGLQFKYLHQILYIHRINEEMLDDCCVQLLIIMDGERNHSMGSPMDGTPPQSKDQ